MSGQGFDQNIGSEWIHYVVLQQPALNITTGANSTYSLIAEVQAAAALMPSTKDLLIFRTFQTTWHGKQEKYLDFTYKGPIEEAAAPRNHFQMKNFVRKLPVLGEDNGEELMPHDIMVAQNGDRKLMGKFDDSSSDNEEIKEFSEVPLFVSRRDGAIHRELEYYATHYMDTMKTIMSKAKNGKLKFIAIPTLAAIGTGLQLVSSAIINHGPGAVDAVSAYNKALKAKQGKIEALSQALKALKGSPGTAVRLDKAERALRPTAQPKKFGRQKQQIKGSGKSNPPKKKQNKTMVKK